MHRYPVAIIHIAEVTMTTTTSEHPRSKGGQGKQPATLYVHAKTETGRPVN
jgi:hypothetical protein